MIDAATKEVKGVAAEVETFVSGITEHVSDMKEHLSCKPKTSSQLFSEEIEVRPLSVPDCVYEGQLEGEEEDHNALAQQPVLPAPEVRHQPMRKPHQQAGGSAARSSGLELEDCKHVHAGMAKGLNAINQHDPKDLIDCGQTDLLDLDTVDVVHARVSCIVQPDVQRSIRASHLGGS